MGQFKSVLVFFLLAEIFFVQTMAARSMGFNPNILKLTVRTGSNSKTEASTGSGSPAISSPSTAESPSSRSSSPEEERGEENVAEPPESIEIVKHHSSDKSVAGGGVIIGGLVTVTFAAVYCYIRVTRKRVGENH